MNTWTIAHCKNDKAVKVSHVFNNGVRIKNSFATMADAYAVIRANEYDVYFPLLEKHRGMPMDEYGVKYANMSLDSDKPAQPVKVSAMPVLFKTVSTLVKSGANVPAKVRSFVPTVKRSAVPAAKRSNVATMATVQSVNSNPRIIEITPTFEDAQIVKDAPLTARPYDYNVKRSINWAAIAFTALVCALVCFLFLSSANVPVQPVAPVAPVVNPVQPVSPVQPVQPVKPSNVVKPSRKSQPTAKPTEAANVESSNSQSVSYSTVKQLRKVYKAEKKLLKADQLSNEANSTTNTVKAARLQKRAEKKLLRAAKKLSRANG